MLINESKFENDLDYINLLILTPGCAVGWSRLLELVVSVCMRVDNSMEYSTAAGNSMAARTCEIIAS